MFILIGRRASWTLVPASAIAKGAKRWREWPLPMRVEAVFIPVLLMVSAGRSRGVAPSYVSSRGALRCG